MNKQSNFQAESKSVLESALNENANTDTQERVSEQPQKEETPMTEAMIIHELMARVELKKLDVQEAIAKAERELKLKIAELEAETQIKIAMITNKVA